MQSGITLITSRAEWYNTYYYTSNNLMLTRRERCAMSTSRCPLHVLVEKHHVKVGKRSRSSQIRFVRKKGAGWGNRGAEPRGGERGRSQRGSADQTWGTSGTWWELEPGCDLVPDIVERSGGVGFWRWECSGVVMSWSWSCSFGFRRFNKKHGAFKVRLLLLGSELKNLRKFRTFLKEIPNSPKCYGWYLVIEC